MNRRERRAAEKRGPQQPTKSTAVPAELDPVVQLAAALVTMQAEVDAGSKYPPRSPERSRHVQRAREAFAQLEHLADTAEHRETVAGVRTMLDVFEVADDLKSTA
jgi:hypothetical protein